MKELLASDDDEENSSKVEKAYVPKLIGKENFIKVLTYIINALVSYCTLSKTFHFCTITNIEAKCHCRSDKCIY